MFPVRAVGLFIPKRVVVVLLLHDEAERKFYMQILLSESPH